MARKPKQKRPQPEASQPAADWGLVQPEVRVASAELTHEDHVAEVCKYFCQGFSPSQIAEIMEQHHGVTMTREVPYKYLKYAAGKGWLQFIGPRADPLSGALRERHDRLQKVEVVPSGLAEDVASRTAAMLVELLREHRRGPQPKDEVHLGFTGGHSMRRVARHLAERLSLPTADLPRRVFFHALVAGFDVDMPMTDPNAFFLYFFRPTLQVEANFVALHAPALVRPDLMRENLKLPGIREAAQRVDEIDIFVTSAAVMADEHSMLSRYLENPPDEEDARKTKLLLERDGCVGDILWQPLSLAGPIDNSDYPYRSMSIVELSRLPGYIRRGRQVLLALGPCGRCGRLKTEILSAILGLKEPIITHLVVDSRTAQEYLRGEKSTPS